jgi:amidase
MSSTPLAFVPGAQVTRAHRGEGALSGLTFAAKDVFDVRGHRASAGHPAWLSSHEPATEDAPTIARVLEAGADLIGVTILDELAYSLAGQNAFYGTPANPRAPGRLCGGSSCGSAAAVAGCLCDFALGTDTGGSIRVPASFCGLFGLRPTHGRIDVRGVVPLAPSFDTVGFLARDARTFELVAEVLLAGSTAGGASSTASRQGVAAEPQIERVLIADDALALCDAGVAELLEHLLAQLLAKLRIPSERIRLSDTSFESLRVAFQRQQGRDAHRTHAGWIEQTRPTFSPAIAQRFERARALSSTQEGAMEDERLVDRLSERMEELLAPGTLLFMPPTPGIAPRTSDSDSALEAFRARTLELTALASLTGLPQLVVPAVELEGAPVGLSFVSAWDTDRELCLLSSLFEGALR